MSEGNPLRLTDEGQVRFIEDVGVHEDSSGEALISEMVH